MGKKHPKAQAQRACAASEAGHMAGAIGRGLVAGLAGTAVMTVAQTAVMKITGRQAGDTPYEAVSKVFGIQAKSEEDRQKLSNIIHWAYGTGWGIPRGLLAEFGVTGAAGSAIHLAALWGTKITMLPALGVAKPVTQWPVKAVVQDILLHALYAAAVGLAADALTRHSDAKRE